MKTYSYSFTKNYMLSAVNFLTLIRRAFRERQLRRIKKNYRKRLLRARGGCLQLSEEEKFHSGYAGVQDLATSLKHGCL